MNGFLHYFLAVFDPTVTTGFSRAFLQLMTSGLPAWWLLGVARFADVVLPAMVAFLFFS